MPFVQLDTSTHAILRIDSAIGPDPDEYGYDRGVSSEWFTGTFSYLDAAGKEITIEVNSIGGRLKDAQTIYHTLKSAKAYTIGHGIGVAASCASYLLMGCNKVRLNEDAQLMIHKISSGVAGTAEEMRKAADAIDKMNESVASVYAGKSGLTVERVLELMDAETWMTAWEALELGFADEVIGFDGTVYTKETAKATAKETRALTLYMHFQQKHNTGMTPEEQKKYDQAVADKTAAEQKLAQLEQEKATLETKLAAEEDAKIDAVIEEAVNAGKITAEMKGEMKTLAKKDFQTTMKVLGTLEGRVKLGDMLNSGKSTGTTKTGDDRKDWSFQMWSEKDEAGLREMRAKDRARFDSLYNAI